MQHNSSFVFYSTVMISVKFSSGRGCNIIFRHLTTKTQQTVEPKNNNNKAIHNCRRTVWFCIFFANFSAALLNGDVPLFRSLVGSLISIQQLHLQVKPPLSLSSTFSHYSASAFVRFASLPTALGGRSCAPLRLRLKFSAVVIFHHSRMWRCRRKITEQRVARAV